MYNIIEAYMRRLTKEDILKFSQTKGANLSPEELDFTYTFVKKNWSHVIKNPQIFDIDRYKNNYSEENFKIIKKAFNEYYQKFGSLL